MRRAALIAGAVAGSLALVSAGAAFAGMRGEDPQAFQAARAHGGFSSFFSSIIDKTTFRDGFWSSFYDSLDPVNVVQAAKNVMGKNSLKGVPVEDRPAVRRGSRAILMKGAGVYGVGVAQFLGFSSLYAFLAERKFRTWRQDRNSSEIRKSLRKTLRSFKKGGGVSGGVEEAQHVDDQREKPAEEAEKDKGVAIVFLVV